MTKFAYVLAGWAWLFCVVPVTQAQVAVTGQITGMVTDTSGAAIEGATVVVSSTSLMQTRTVQTQAGGVYLVAQLPPGEYTVKYSQEGFGSVVHNGIVLTAGFVATLNATLTVGTVSESISVTGADTPVVDVQSSTTPTTFDSTLLQDTPSGRDPWSTLAQTPGITTSTFDVAGNNSYQQSSMSVHGSKTTETVYAFNGLDLNGPSQTSTGFYVDYDSFQEVQMVTDAAPPEVPIGGSYMNMITRSGSNQFHGFAAAYYLDSATQATINPPIFNSQPVTNAGSPFIRALDATVNAGGPILKDRWWIFGAYRSYDLKQLLLNSPQATGGFGTDVNHQTNTTLRNDVKISSKNQLNLQWLWNFQNRFFRRSTTYSYVDQDAAYVQIEPAYILEGQETYTPTTNLTIDSRIGYMQVVFPEYYQPTVASQTIPAVDIAQSTLKYAGLENYLNKEKVGRVASTASYFKSGWHGSHILKAGADFGIARNYVNYNYNQDIFEFYNSVTPAPTPQNPNPVAPPPNTNPWEVQVQNGPTLSNTWAHMASFFAQDAWTMNSHFTLSFGFRFDHSHAYMAPQCDPAVGIAEYAPLFQNRCLAQFQTAGSPLGPLTKYSNVDTYNNIVPRISLAYDPTGRGNQVIRAGFNMFTLNAGTSLADAVNPEGPAVAIYGWNGSFIANSATPGAANSATPDYTQFAPACGTNPLGTNGCLAGGTYTGKAAAGAGGYLGTTGGTTTYIDPNLKRPYSIEINVGYERTILRDTSFGVAYFFRTTKDLFAPINVNAPAADYTAVTTYQTGSKAGQPIVNPLTGAPMTLYNLVATDVGKNYYEITNVAAANNNRYDGVEFTLSHRLAHHWQALVGYTIQRERGDYIGSATASSSEDFNDPNRGINRYGSIDQDSPYVVRADLTYQAPLKFQVAVNFQHETGFAILPTNTFGGLTQGSETVKLGGNGSLRYNSVNDTNLRISRPTTITERFTIEPLVDLYNLFNARPIIAETTTAGANFQKPTNFLGPFVARFGCKLNF
jgi:Carboxypeptidase regulatory-like domain